MLYLQRWKVILASLVVLTGFLLFAALSLISWPTLQGLPGGVVQEVTDHDLNLQGARLVYRIDEKMLFEDWLGNIRSEVRETLRNNRIGFKNLMQNTTAHAISLRIRKPEELDKALAALRSLSDSVDAANDLDVTLDGNEITLAVTEAGLNDRIGSMIETIRRRVEAFGATEVSVQREGATRILVEAFRVKDVKHLKALIGETGKLEFKLVDPAADAAEIAISKKVPIGSELVYSDDEPPVPYVLKDRVLFSGKSIVDAQPNADPRSGEPVLNFRFDAASAKRFGLVTQENVGPPFAIVLNGKVISAPVIREPILGGSGQISGNFSPEEVEVIAVWLRHGALPIKLTLIEERILEKTAPKGTDM